MELDASGRPRRLSPAERLYRQQNGLCYYCGGSDHHAKDHDQAPIDEEPEGQEEEDNADDGKDFPKGA